MPQKTAHYAPRARKFSPRGWRSQNAVWYLSQNDNFSSLNIITIFLQTISTSWKNVRIQQTPTTSQMRFFPNNEQFPNGNPGNGRGGGGIQFPSHRYTLSSLIPWLKVYSAYREILRKYPQRYPSIPRDNVILVIKGWGRLSFDRGYLGLNFCSLAGESCMCASVCELEERWNNGGLLLLQIYQDDTSREKTLQLMANMSGAQIVSAGSAIHNKMSPALEGPLALHASTPVSYPGAVSPTQTHTRDLLNRWRGIHVLHTHAL